MASNAKQNISSGTTSSLSESRNNNMNNASSKYSISGARTLAAVLFRRLLVEVEQKPWLREALCVSAYTMACCILRLIVCLLMELGKYKWHGEREDGGVMFLVGSEVMGCLSYLSKLLLSFLPTTSLSSSTSTSSDSSADADTTSLVVVMPGLIFTALLFPMQSYFKCPSCPSLPIRITEMVLGRLTARQLVSVILPIHFASAVLGAFALRMLLPSAMEQTALEPIVYSEQNPWTVDFAKEVLLTALYTVTMLVTPELLKLNKISRGFVPLLLWPLYRGAVDANGLGSSFSPNVLYALRCVSRHEEVPFRQSSHLLGPIVGALLGGKIMKMAFPDPRGDR